MHVYNNIVLLHAIQQTTQCVGAYIHGCTTDCLARIHRYVLTTRHA